MQSSFQYAPPYFVPPFYSPEPPQSSFFIPQHDIYYHPAFPLQMQQIIPPPRPENYLPNAHVAHSPPDASANGPFRSHPTIPREQARLRNRKRSKSFAERTTNPVPASIVSSSSYTPCAPPRKPKQSGHALWVGNLPSETKIGDLKDHFSLDPTTRDIESIFLISRSNCAFVNYRTEATCLGAIERFHCSSFQGARLSCRLRQKSRSNVEQVGKSETVDGLVNKQSASRDNQPDLIVTSTPTKIDHDVEQATRNGQGDYSHTCDSKQVGSPKNETPNELPTKRKASRDEQPDLIVTSTPTKIDRHLEQTPQINGKVDGLDTDEIARDKYFIIKSLTLEDVTQSVHSGQWATQPHNEAKLALALEQADDVYLIFSVNKSGEYFGYARITSLIAGECTRSSRPVLMEQHNDKSDASHFVVTPATLTAPKGRIFNDSARGTVFWEAVPLDDKEATSRDTSRDGQEGHDDRDDESGAKDQRQLSHQFNIRWLSTSRLPFYSTRGLRNPWNANREVKVARDGTEVETLVGRQLVWLFHRQSMSDAMMPDEGMNLEPNYQISPTGRQERAFSSSGQYVPVG